MAGDSVACPIRTPKPVLLEFDMGNKKNLPFQTAASKHDKPWRKSAAAVAAERKQAAEILGEAKNVGVNLSALQEMMLVQEVINTAQDSSGLAKVQGAVTALLQVATNACEADELSAARTAVEQAVEEAGLSTALARQRVSGRASLATVKLQLLHEVIPRLWVGGWAALNNDCEALRQRRITHVVSVVSAEQRKLPEFIQGHHYICVDDTQEAAAVMAANFEGIVAFIEAAREAGGAVFVHCGAGISRAPTATAAYLIWKLRITAADAIKLIRCARSVARPNVGFVSELKVWEQKIRSAESCQQTSLH